MQSYQCREHKPWVKRVERRISNTKRHKDKLKRLEKDLNQYPSPVYIKERDGKSILVRCYTSRHANSRAALYKKKCNRAVRRYKGELGSGGKYRKIADYWWLLY